MTQITYYWGSSCVCIILSENISDLLYNRTIIENYLIISNKEPFLYYNVAIMVGARPNRLRLSGFFGFDHSSTIKITSKAETSRIILCF